MPATSKEFRFWIDMALECVRRDHTPTLSSGDQKGPFLSARALGMALGALSDVAAARVQGPQLLQIPVAAFQGDAVVAAAAACHEVLLRRYPKQGGALRGAWQEWLELFGKTAGGSEIAGRGHGAAVDVFGANDPDFALINRYQPTGADYTHQRPDHEPNQIFSGGDWGAAKPLVVPVVQNFAKPFGRVNATMVTPNDANYLADFAAVKAKGHWNRAYGGQSGRTQEEELKGIFWGYDGPKELGTPPRLYLQVLLSVLDSLDANSPGALGASEELLLVASVAVAMADSGISAWHYKYSGDHMMWRPVIGVRKAPKGGGAPDPNWLPLGRPDTNGAGTHLTPDFPAYPSGHATFGAAAFQLTRLFFVHKGLATFDDHGVDNIRFNFVSDEFNGRNTDPRTSLPRNHVKRSFNSLWDATVENSISRALLGVHWYFDGISIKDGDGSAFGTPSTPDQLGKVGGVWLGAQVANHIAVKLGVPADIVSKSKM
ncbi:MAG: hypothetical protein RL588_1736 [Pseudomonadota bacterium]